MPINTVTVTGKFLAPDGITPLSGTVNFYLPATVSFPESDLFVDGVSNNTLNASGSFSAILIATDNSNQSPSGWAYEVVEKTNARTRSYWVAVPSTPSTVDLSDIAPMDPTKANYVLIRGVDGAPGPAGADGLDGMNGTNGTNGASGVPGPAGSDGADGSITRTAKVRVTDDNLGGIPSAPTWTVIKTSSNTSLQCSIDASVGDRVRVCGSFMRSGSRFLDWVLLDSSGVPSVYAASETSAPLAEGNPTMYPSLSFSYVPGSEMFVVGAGHIDVTGKVTVALTNQGVASGVVHAHPLYPWRLRLENIGPEPS